VAAAESEPGAEVEVEVEVEDADGIRGRMSSMPSTMRMEGALEETQESIAC
jgi:hypothetical protein